jgi:hypothetical protein
MIGFDAMLMGLLAAGGVAFAVGTGAAVAALYAYFTV